MSKLSCEGIGEMVVTLPAADGVAGGQVVTLGEDGQVAACASGQRPRGVALEPRGGCAAVQVGGFARVACSDSTVKPGFVTLCGDGKGGVKKAGQSDTGGEFLVAMADGTTATIRL